MRRPSRSLWRVTQALPITMARFCGMSTAQSASRCTGFDASSPAPRAPRRAPMPYCMHLIIPSDVDAETLQLPAAWVSPQTSRGCIVSTTKLSAPPPGHHPHHQQHSRHSRQLWFASLAFTSGPDLLAASCSLPQTTPTAPSPPTSASVHLYCPVREPLRHPCAS